MVASCSETSNEKVIGILLENGANLERVDEDNWKALHFASGSNCAENVATLLKHGAVIEARTNMNETPLFLACDENDLDSVQVLVQHGANVFAMNGANETPLDRSGDTDIIKYFLDLFKDKILERDGRLSLHAVLQEAKYSGAHVQLKIGMLSIVQFLSLLKSIDAQDPDMIRNQDSNRAFPLHIAASTNAPLRVLSFLIKQDPAILYTMDSAGNLPIHQACRVVWHWTRSSFSLKREDRASFALVIFAVPYRSMSCANRNHRWMLSSFC